MEKLKVTEYSLEDAWYKDRVGEDFPFLRANEEKRVYIVQDIFTNEEREVGWNDGYLFDDDYELNQELDFHEAMRALEKGWSIRIHHPKLCRNIGLNKRMGTKHLLEVLHDGLTNFSFQNLMEAKWTIIDKEF